MLEKQRLVSFGRSQLVLEIAFLVSSHPGKELTGKFFARM
jgi:hypothetical protein